MSLRTTTTRPDRRARGTRPRTGCEQASPSPSGSAPAAPGCGRVELAFTRCDLGAVRQLVRQVGAEASLSEERCEDLTLAVSELASNSVCHGGGEGSLHIWRDGRAIVCEVRDAGYIAEPWLGRVRPEPGHLSGRGLWLVEQACDLVQIRSSRRAGSAVRVHMRLAPEAAATQQPA
jgi:anti-sigma regulatory factor (Ser/Thr protein kinase)